jgi:hypothetical protein
LNAVGLHCLSVDYLCIIPSPEGSGHGSVPVHKSSSN